MLTTSLFNKISFSMCLVLDKRIQNWFNIREEFQKIGFNVLPYIVGDGKTLDNEVYSRIDRIEEPPHYDESTSYPTWWKYPYHAYQAWQCHNNILNLFLQNSSPSEYLLLLEDDVKIQPEFYSTMINVEDWMNSHEIDALYLGSYNNSHTWSPTDNENIMRLHGSAGWHAVVLKHELCQDLVNLFPFGPYDESFGRLHKHYNVYGIYPSIVSQESGWSFIEGSNLDKPSIYSR